MLAGPLSKTELLDWMIDQLDFSGFFDRKILGLWRGLPLHERALVVSGAFQTIPPTEKIEIAMRFAALGANQGTEWQ